MSSSDLVILKNELVLMILLRFTEIFTFVLCLITLRIIHVHSARSLGAFKYCLYQIVILPLLSQQCNIFGPIFVVPIIGAYMTIDFTDNPAVIHGILCVWILICALDIEAILDGFNYRLRTLVITFYPQRARKWPWIPLLVFAKVMALLLVGGLIAPIGPQLKRDEMRQYLENNYPNAIATFDEHKTFIVYDLAQITDFGIAAIAMATGMAVLVCYSLVVIALIFRQAVMRIHSNQMSKSTKRMHSRFVIQLSLQASVPFFVLVCPLFAILLLTLSSFQFQTNLPGYVIHSLLMLHGPLSAVLTLALYDPYRKAVINFTNERILCRVAVTPLTASPSTTNAASIGNR